MIKRFILLLVVVLMCASVFSACEKNQEKDVESEDTVVTDVTEAPENDIEDDVEKDSAEAVDVDELDKIEKNDTFAVRVTDIKLVEGLFDNGSTVVDLNGEDGFLLEVSNYTNSEVNEVKFLILCTDKDGKACTLGGFGSIPQTIIQGHSVVTYSNKVQFMGVNTAGISSADSEEIAGQCSLGDIAKVNALVYSYIDADGNEVVNDNFVNWLSYTNEVSVK